jgi:hypothetical protein
MRLSVSALTGRFGSDQAMPQMPHMDAFLESPASAAAARRRKQEHALPRAQLDAAEYTVDAKAAPGVAVSIRHHGFRA